MMKRKILALILVASLSVMMLYGCGAIEPVDETGVISTADYGRFSEVFYTANISVITDAHTSSQYLVYRSANGTGLTMMNVKD